MNWQPIETAPKDGTWVLVYENGWEPDHGDIDIAHFRDSKSWMTYEDLRMDLPSHWMPLPESPK
jgi:hypothetical protein